MRWVSRVTVVEEFAMAWRQEDTFSANGRIVISLL